MTAGLAAIAPAAHAVSACRVNNTVVTGTMISGTGGDDVILCGSVEADTTVNGGGGNDQITVVSHVAGFLYGGAGEDAIRVDGNTFEQELTGPTTVTGTIRGGAPVLGTLADGKDVIDISGAYGTKNGGDAVTGTVAGDAGADKITVTGGNAAAGQAGVPGQGVDGSGSVQGGGGADEITVNGGYRDTFGSYRGPAVGSGEVRGGGPLGVLLDGDDTITLDSDIVSGTVNGDAGEDNISVQTNGGEVRGSTGDDRLEVTFRNDGVVDGGLGSDLCVIEAGNPPQNCE
ncbi:hypothetical protein ABT354_30570 [Streptomyces sp. NPDC000594]|uniref:hypothetical protein n=1 Tax=Streptomyces sp. NPDC000594 TaxID=3154261 RepID=UPI00332FD03C